MKSLIAVFIAASLALAGCVNKPDASKLLAKQAEATKHVTAAKAQFAAAKTKLRETAVTHKKTVEHHTTATKWVTLIVPAVDSFLFRVPDEYKPEVEAIKAQVEELRIAIELATDPIAATTQGLKDTDTKVVEGEESLRLAIAAQDKINTKLTPDFLAQVNESVESLAKMDGKLLLWRLLAVGTWIAVVALFAFKNYLKTVPFVGLLFR